MIFINPRTVVFHRTPDAQFWTAHDDRLNEWLAEVFVRRPTGIFHLVRRYRGERPSDHTLYRDACEHGVFSPNPYPQACDGSITTCVVALFVSFCDARKVDPRTLLRQAYADNPSISTAPDFAETRGQADWERTAYPEQWDESAIEGLLESLHAINYHDLANVVEYLLEAERS